MPLLSDEEVLRFNTEIDELEQKRSKLDKLNDIYLRDLKLKKSQLRKSIIACVILLICFLGSLSMFFLRAEATIENDATEIIANKEEKKTIKEEVTPQVIVKEEPLLSNQEEVIPKDHKAFYGVQIGAFQEYDIDYTVSIRRLTKGKLNCYVVGGFTEEESAENFKLFLNKVGLPQAYVVKLEDE